MHTHAHAYTHMHTHMHTHTHAHTHMHTHTHAHTHTHTYTHIYTHAYRLLKSNSIFSTTYGPSTSTLICLYKSYIHSLFDYGAPATCVSSPDIQLSWERIQTHFISWALSIPSFIHNDRKRHHAYLPPIHDRNLYLAKCWCRRAMQHNRGVQDYSDNHIHDNCNIHCSRNTPLELSRDYLQVGKPQENVNVKSKQWLFLLSDKDPCGWPLRRFLFLLSSFCIRNPKNCKHKKYEKKCQQNKKMAHVNTKHDKK